MGALYCKDELLTLAESKRQRRAKTNPVAANDNQAAPIKEAGQESSAIASDEPLSEMETNMAPEGVAGPLVTSPKNLADVLLDDGGQMVLDHHTDGYNGEDTGLRGPSTESSPVESPCLRPGETTAHEIELSEATGAMQPVLPPPVLSPPPPEILVETPPRPHISLCSSDLKNLNDMELAEKIRANDKAVCDLAEVVNNVVRQSLEQVIMAGNALLEARRRCAHGEWGPWQKLHLPDIPPSRVSRYLAVAERISHVRNLDAIQSVRQLYLACGVIKEPKKSSQLVKAHKSSGSGSIEGMLTQAQETRKAMRLFLNKNKAESLSMETKSQLRMELRELVEILRLLTDGGTPDLPEEPHDQSDE